jgi:preprotein translocase subunit SecE
VRGGNIFGFYIIVFSGFKFKKMNKISNYFRESYFELTEKVTWPTWLQLQQSTIIVLITTLIITALVWMMDFASQNLLKAIYSLFK